MTTRDHQLPWQPSDLAADIARLWRQLTELRGQKPDLAAADALLPPLDVDSSRWPQTSLASYTTIASCSNLRWGSQLRLALATATSGGGGGNIRVLINGVPWGPVTVAGAPLDYTAPLPADIAIGEQYQITVEAQRTSGAGTVHAQTQLIRSVT